MESVKAHTIEPDYNKFRSLFGWLSADTVKKTLAAKTQYALLPFGTVLKRAFKSSNPAFNVLRRNEAVACDYCLFLMFLLLTMVRMLRSSLLDETPTLWPTMA